MRAGLLLERAIERPVRRREEIVEFEQAGGERGSSMGFNAKSPKRKGATRQTASEQGAMDDHGLEDYTDHKLVLRNHGVCQFREEIWGRKDHGAAGDKQERQNHARTESFCEGRLFRGYDSVLP